MSDTAHRKHINFLSSLPPSYAKEPEQSVPVAADPSEIGRLKAEKAKLRAQLAKRGRS